MREDRGKGTSAHGHMFWQGKTLRIAGVLANLGEATTWRDYFGLYGREWHGKQMQWCYCINKAKALRCCCQSQVIGMLMWTGQVSLWLSSWQHQSDPLQGSTGGDNRRPDGWIDVKFHCCVHVCWQEHIWAYLPQWHVPCHPAYPAPRSLSRTPGQSAPQRAGDGRSVCRRAGLGAPWSESKRHVSAVL